MPGILSIDALTLPDGGHPQPPLTVADVLLNYREKKFMGIRDEYVSK